MDVGENFLVNRMSRRGWRGRKDITVSKMLKSGMDNKGRPSEALVRITFRTVRLSYHNVRQFCREMLSMMRRMLRSTRHIPCTLKILGSYPGVLQFCDFLQRGHRMGQLRECTEGKPLDKVDVECRIFDDTAAEPHGVLRSWTPACM